MSIFMSTLPCIWRCPGQQCEQEHVGTSWLLIRLAEAPEGQPQQSVSQPDWAHPGLSQWSQRRHCSTIALRRAIAWRYAIKVR